MKQLKLLIILILLILTAGVYSQNNKPAPLDAKLRTSTVNKIAKLLNENYVFPETAKKMGNYIKSQLKSGAYDNITEVMPFAEALTADLVSISKDKHIRVRFNPETAAMLLEEENKGEDPEQEKRMLEMMQSENFGFKKVERLGGNIGYVDFRNFAPADLAKETIAGVMEFLSHTDAIIFDIRLNGGGAPDCVRLICSYLFGEEPVHLNSLYNRPNDVTREFWTLRKVDGKKMPDVPVYILTSKFTFSAAEEFTYDLKTQKRAVIVGETTGGGAHPGGMVAINKSFVMFVPTGRAINPITKTNWEGVGVTPDVSIASERALEQAQILALEKLSADTKNPERKTMLKWMAESLQGAMNAPLIDENTLKSYAGTYKDRTVIYDNGKLYYQRGGRQKYIMTAISEDTFMFKDIDFFRLKFIKDANGNVTEINGLYDNGDVDKSTRNN